MKVVPMGSQRKKPDQKFGPIGFVQVPQGCPDDRDACMLQIAST